jgi:hypothetical protein
MRALTLALAFALATIAGVRAEEAVVTTCADESSVRHAAEEINAREVVPIRSRSGFEFLMLVLPTGNGLVISKGASGCFDTAMAMPEEIVAELLAHSRAS